MFKFLNNTKISRKVQLLLFIFIIGFAGFAVMVLYSFISLTETAVKPNLYKEVQTIIAKPDISLVEAYSTLQEIVFSSTDKNNVIKLEADEGRFETAQKLIENKNLDVALAELLTKTNYENGTLFFKIARERLIPAVEAGDKKLVESILHKELKPLLEKAKINLKEASTKTDITLNKAVSESRHVFYGKIIFLIIIFVLTLFLVIVISLFIIGSLKPISIATEHILELSRGKIDREVAEKYLVQKDEIGQLATAIKEITTGLREKTMAMENISKGNIQVDVPIRSKEDILAQSIGRVKNTLVQIVEDTNLLTEAALSGQLSVRADHTKHQGEFKRIVEGINHAAINTVTSIQTS